MLRPLAGAPRSAGCAAYLRNRRTRHAGMETPAELKARYFSGKADGLAPAGGEMFLTAAIGE